MGLDTYAMARGADGEWEPAPDEPFAGIHLVGGVFSGGAGSSSMRGKVYANVVQAATGESLYRERIEPAAVAEMARRLRGAVEEAKRAGTRAGTSEHGVVDEEGRIQFDEEGRLRIESEEIAVLDVAGEEIDAHEAEDLARWFEVCAEHGYAVDGWF
jgi:hypothetical protein